MKIHTKFYSKVTVWELNEAIVEVDSEEQFLELVRKGELLSKCDDINYVNAEYLLETVADIGEYDFDVTSENYEIIGE